MNTTQENYIIAKTTYDEICSIVWNETDKRIEAAGLNEDDEKNDDAIIDIMIEIENETGKHEAMLTYHEAETELLKWGKMVTLQNIKNYAEYKPHAKTILALWDKTHKPTVRSKLVDLTLKLAA